MSANGDGNGNHGDGEPRTPLDRLVRFVSEQNPTLSRRCGPRMNAWISSNPDRAAPGAKLGRW